MFDNNSSLECAPRPSLHNLVDYFWRPLPQSLTVASQAKAKHLLVTHQPATSTTATATTIFDFGWKSRPAKQLFFDRCCVKVNIC